MFIVKKPLIAWRKGQWTLSLRCCSNICVYLCVCLYVLVGATKAPVNSASVFWFWQQRLLLFVLLYHCHGQNNTREEGEGYRGLASRLLDRRKCWLLNFGIVKLRYALKCWLFGHSLMSASTHPNSHDTHEKLTFKRNPAINQRVIFRFTLMAVSL